MAEENNDPQEIWEDFWEEIVTDEDGDLDVEQVKKELADFHHVMQQVPLVYEHITGGELSKIMYYSSAVIECHEKHIQSRIKEELELLREEMVEQIETLLTRDLRDYNIPAEEWEALKSEWLGQR